MKYLFSLCGARAKEWVDGIWQAEFSIDAYKEFCLKMNVDWPDSLGGNAVLEEYRSQRQMEKNALILEGLCSPTNQNERHAEETPPWDLPLEQDKSESDSDKQKESEISQPECKFSDTQTIIEGLTVADVRRMCERSGALASVLRAVAQWQAIEKENPERMTTDVLLSKLKIAARKDGWGTDKGELAKSQKEQLQKMILDKWRPGGRPRKNSND